MSVLVDLVHLFRPIKKKKSNCKSLIIIESTVSRSPAPPSERSKKTSSSQLRQHGGSHAIHHPIHRRTGSAGGVGGVVTASGTYQHHTSEAPDDSVVNVNSGLMGVPNVRFKAVPSISILSFRAGRAQAIKY